MKIHIYFYIQFNSPMYMYLFHVYINLPMGNSVFRYISFLSTNSALIGRYFQGMQITNCSNKHFITEKRGLSRHPFMCRYMMQWRKWKLKFNECWLFKTRQYLPVYYIFFTMIPECGLHLLQSVILFLHTLSNSAVCPSRPLG